MNPRNVIDIAEGRTNDFLIHGLFVLIAGGVLFLVHWGLMAIMVALAIALFLLSSGIEVDIANKRARVYKALGKFHFGTWIGMDRYNSISIRYVNESQVMSNRGVETNVRVRTYDLYCHDQLGNSLLFHDFTDYGNARRCADTMVTHWSLALTDEIQERRQRSQAIRLTRRR